MAYKIGDFTFETEVEAKAAEKEAKAIAYITQQMESCNPKAVRALYCQMIEKDLFHTKLGIAFLEEIHDQLVKEKSLAGENIPNVPRKEIREINKKVRGVEGELKKYKKATHILMIVCITMGIIIGGMFAVNATSQHPTILNYEQKILNKYAAWEEELNQREEELTKREQRLSQ